MAIGFPPIPLYPTALDNDRTLYTVYNTAEAALTANNAAWSEELLIEPRQVGQQEVWAENGFVNLSGELIYYDAVEKDSDGFVNKLKRCARNLAGTHTKFNLAGTIVRGFVVAEHHNQLVAAIVNVEKFIGVNDDTDEDTIDWRIRDLADAPVIFDDFSCPDINFNFNIVSADPASGTLANYDISITGNFTSFTLSFGDGSSTSSSLAGQHRYAPNATIDPVVTCTNASCQIVQTPVERDVSEQPRAPTATTTTLPTPPSIEFPDIIINDFTMPDPDLAVPPLVLPCPGTLSIAGGIQIPSIIIFQPELDIPSFIEFSPIDIPSVITFPDINLPSLIDFGNFPSFSTLDFPSIISFTDAPTIPSVIDFGDFPTVPDIQFGDFPSIPSIQFAPVPSIPAISFTDFPTVPNVEFGDVPTFPEISFVDVTFPEVSFADVTFPEVSFATISFPDINLVDSLPSEISLIGNSVPSEISLMGSVPSEISLICCSLPDVITISLDSSISGGIPIDINGLISFNVGGGLQFDLQQLSSARISVDWGTPPTLNVQIVCPSATSLTGFTSFNSAAAHPNFDAQQDMTVDYDLVGFPSEISMVLPTLPDVRILHDLPSYIPLRLEEIPELNVKIPEFPDIRISPVDIQTIIGLSTIQLDASSLPTSIELTSSLVIPSVIEIDASRLPRSIAVEGMPSTISLIYDFPGIPLLLPEKAEISVVFPKEPVMIQFAPITASTSEDLPCFALVPCKK